MRQGSFISISDQDAECTSSRFADDAQLGGVADGQYGCAAIQRDLNRLKKWPTMHHKVPQRKMTNLASVLE